MRSPLASVEEALPLRLSIERRRGRDRTRGGLGQTTRVRTRQAGKAQRGWRAGARTRPHLGPAHLPGFVQEGAVIDVWAPFEERGRRPTSGRSAGRLESIDYYR